jgi:hypothetical protein
MKCLDCDVILTSEWLAVQDAMQLCPPCYEKLFGEGE